jgi:solute carrier family 25 phosphate transporter 23/24/25/41
MFMCGGERVRQCGVVQGLRNIYSHEGFRGFFRGNTANVARIYPFTAIQLSSYPFFKSVMTLGDDKNMTVGIRFWSGVFAGFLATFCTYPMDFIRCRLSMQTEKHALYRGLVDGIVTVARQEGFLRLYTGIWPSLLGIIPYAGFQLSTYDMTRNALMKHYGEEHSTKLITFASGSIAGMVAQTAAFPIEMIRRRMQVRGFQLGGIVDPNAVRLDKEPTFMGELRTVIREGGVKGLYRGIVPNYIKIVPAAGCNFLVFEYAKGLWDDWQGHKVKAL